MVQKKAEAASRVTISDVAQAAGVSTASVSYFLNGRLEKLGQKTQARIEHVIRETGYIPSAQARSLSGKQTHVIAIIIKDNANDWAGKFLEGVERVALANGYATIVCASNFNPETEIMYVEKMLSMGVDGFIIQPTQNFKVVTERIEKTGTPLVCFDFAAYDLQGTWIKTNLYDGFYRATTELIDAGYEDFICVAADTTTIRSRIERFQGFVDALSARRRTYKMLSITHDTPSVAKLREYFQYKLNPARRSLIFVQNQWALPRIYKALKPMAHLMPKQIGLIGLNCTEWTDLVDPPVSVIAEPVNLEGAQACKMLLNILKQQGDASEKHIDESTTPAESDTAHRSSTRSNEAQGDAGKHGSGSPHRSPAERSEIPGTHQQALDCEIIWRGSTSVKMS
ncbi:LacI family transcriptional regulator [Collinsella sp. AGMB00827]|uniref:LacI family transcriptional regulator n=1 Tax=Collinsella ureilytica TaxID=2869515 RepID=A0ABS7MIJ6_9ACTN|nr:LacI family DNA-binding transcriptional regulator [Collinsella urealyticum]MBY4797193.1 LacI family transcriptional regulator [Collinsella urealyticum]